MLNYQVWLDHDVGILETLCLPDQTDIHPPIPQGWIVIDKLQDLDVVWIVIIKPLSLQGIFP